MLNPNQLSDEALAILRMLAQSGHRKSGSAMTLATIEQSWKRSKGDLEAGLADLEIARLVDRSDSGTPRAIVTEEGEAFFKRYYLSCH